MTFTREVYNSVTSYYSNNSRKQQLNFWWSECVEVLLSKQRVAIMDKKLNRNNIESIKKTMQIHEDIFKHQVRELHRIYDVQKMLMNELKTKTSQQISRGIDLEKPAKEKTLIVSSFGIDEGEVGTSSYTTAFRNCNEENEEMEVDLTLSIGGSKVKNSNMKLQLGECNDTETVRSNSVTFSQGLQLK